MPPAYIVSLIRPIDRDLSDQYRAIAAETIAQYGGRYVVRGGLISEVIEGESSDRRVIVLEFPDADSARAWYASPEYAKAKEIAPRAFGRTMLLAEGM
jgi:uncharacterized protein (DUF1330 family)